MGQREKDRALVESEYEFTTHSSRPPEAVSQAALRAAESSGGGLRGNVKNAGGRKGEDGTFTSFFVVKGPGGFVDIMDFSVTAKPRTDGGAVVSLSIGQFTFQKGSFGMKPSIDGRAVIANYVTLLQGAF